MGSLHQLGRELYAEEVRRAREMDATDKLLEGPRLFDRACRLVADGIRHEAAVIEALDASDVPYMIVGSLASNFHGSPGPRATSTS